MYNVTGGCGAVASLPDLTFKLDGADYVLAPQQYIAKVPASSHMLCTASTILMLLQCASTANCRTHTWVLHAAAGEQPRVLHLCGCRRRRPALLGLGGFLHARILLDFHRQRSRPERHDRAGRVCVKAWPRVWVCPVGLLGLDGRFHHRSEVSQISGEEHNFQTSVAVSVSQCLSALTSFSHAHESSGRGHLPRLLL